MLLSDFHYDLPPELIARYPLAKRSSSRLLHIDPEGQIKHRQFTDLPMLFTPKDLIVFNNSKVIPARLFGNKDSGGRIEILVERILDERRVLVHLRASKPPKLGTYLNFEQEQRFLVLAREQGLFTLECAEGFKVIDIIESLGEIPLPPYLHRAAEESDKERYQTVYAQPKGSVAAPTAGLHFDQELLANLTASGIDTAFVTLHVGAGTFLPVRTENLQEHRLHAEYIEISAETCAKIRRTKAQGGRVIAVGTTTARSLESASRQGEIQAYSGETDLFIYPGYRFNCVDVLLTNFHLPDSSLLMLVAAFGGYEAVMNAYQQAVEQRYRFYSYGDAMLLSKVTHKMPVVS